MAATRRKVFPNDVYTWLSAATLAFLLSGIVLTLIYLGAHYNVLGF